MWSIVYEIFSKAPLYHLVLEALLLLWVVWLLLRKSYHPREQEKLTEKEKDELIAEWIPEPLVPEVADDHPALHPRTVDGKIGKFLKVNGKKCLNVGTHNYLALSWDERVVNEAVNCLHQYGVGSCGPRAFYGTAVKHIELEEALAKFLSVEQAVLYSYGFATIASAIPAYAKKGDVIFADESCNFAIQKGIQASRSQVYWFRHNDMDHLSQLLDEQAVRDVKNPKKAKVMRRFLVVEGIYQNTGNICPLPELVKLRKKHKLRLYVDESVSFCVLGSTGRGVFEHYGIPIDEADWVCVSLEFATGSVGGFSAGTSYVVDHQSLAGLGYCFSASLPPLLAAAALETLKLFQAEPQVLNDLQNVCQDLHDALQGIPGLGLHGDCESPVKLLTLEDPSENRRQDEQKLRKIVEKCEDEGVAVVVSEYLPSEHLLPPPSIRVTANSTLKSEDLTLIRVAITSASRAVLSV